MKRMKKLLAFLLAAMLLLSMIPISASAEDYPTVTSKDRYFTVNYKDRVTGSGFTLNINLKKPDGTTLDSITIEHAGNSDNRVNVYLADSIAEQYDFAYGTSDDSSTNAAMSGNNAFIDQYYFLFNGIAGSNHTVDLYLCDQRNYEGEAINTKATIEYRAQQPALLKLLHDAGVNVTKETKVEDVSFTFVNKYGNNTTWNTFTETPTGANNLAYFQTSLSDVNDFGSPSNIASFGIEYSGNVSGTKTIPVDDLLFVRGDGNVYYIDSADKKESIVAFYYEPGAEATTWSLWDVRFVTTGKALGAERMPEDPTYDEWGAIYVFNCWQDAPNGGNVFYPYAEVSDDLVVYADKESSSIGGTEYRVINNDTQIIGRFVEIYNAMNNANYSADDVDTDSVKMQVNGTDSFTNKEYWNNGWRLRGDDYYYRVVNSDLSLVSGERYNNTHVPHNEAKSVTIFATINGVSAEVTIPIDENVPGALALEGGSTVQDHYINIVVNPDPNAPTEEELTGDPEVPGDTGLLGNNAVTIDCTNETAGHESETYGLEEGTTGELKTLYNANTEEVYFGYVITVQPEKYVEQYNKNYTETLHKLDPANQAAKTITLVYDADNSEWTLPKGAAPVEYTVKCETQQGGEEPDKPEKPDENDIIDMLKSIVKVDCSTTENHTSGNPEYYNFESGYGTITGDSEGVKGSESEGYRYKIKVSLTVDDANHYIGKFDAQNEHELTSIVPEVGQEFTLVYLPAQENATEAMWIIDPNESGKFITINVTCKDGGGEQPEEPNEPTAPTYGDLKALIDVTVDCTNTDVTHASQTYGLIDNSVAPNYSVSAISQDDEGNDTCTVTVYAGEYIVKYENNTNNVAHGLTSEANKTETIKLTLGADGKWALADGEDGTVTFKVKCGSKIIHVTDPGEDHWYPVYVDPEDPTDPDQTGVSDLLETDDHIQYLFGYPDDSFGPDRNMTRAEAAQMFYNLLKDQDVEAASVFDDVPEGRLVRHSRQHHGGAGHCKRCWRRQVRAQPGNHPR